MSLGKENGRCNTNKNTKDVYALRDDWRTVQWQSMVLNGLIFNPWSNEINCTKETKAESPALFPVRKVRKLMPVSSWVNIDFSHEFPCAPLPHFDLKDLEKTHPLGIFDLLTVFICFLWWAWESKLTFASVLWTSKEQHELFLELSRVSEWMQLPPNNTSSVGKSNWEQGTHSLPKSFWRKVTQQKVQLIFLYLQPVLNTCCTNCKRKSICKMQYVTCDMCVEWVCSIVCESMIPSSLESFKCHHPKVLWGSVWEPFLRPIWWGQLVSKSCEELGHQFYQIEVWSIWMLPRPTVTTKTYLANG